ncbi:MAG: alkaline phosphatase family protein, partial [Microbacteriaceae bacterium]
MTNSDGARRSRLLRWGRSHRAMAIVTSVVVIMLVVVGVTFGVTFGVNAGLTQLHAFAGSGATGGSATDSAGSGIEAGISKIKHIVIIMQENRSFDSYFGAFPGADGIPMVNGTPSVCVPDPASGGCQKPYHDPADVNAGGPHGAQSATADIDGGAMDGFVGQAEQAKKNCAANDPACAAGTGTDVMGYKTGADIPNYWRYAKDFVLDDHLFESNASWSLPSHLYMVSEWSAKCSTAGDPASCVNALESPSNPPDFGAAAKKNLIGACRGGMQTPACQAQLAKIGITPDMAAQMHALIQQHCAKADSLATCQAAVDAATLPEALKQKLITASAALAPPDYAWTDLTYLLHKQQVSWGYYVFNGTEPDCEDDSAMTCAPVKQNAKTPGIWNPLPYFDTVRQDHQLGNIQSLTNFYTAART